MGGLALIFLVAAILSLMLPSGGADTFLFFILLYMIAVVWGVIQLGIKDHDNNPK